MEKGTMEAARAMTLVDLKEAAQVAGPCLTITVPVQPAPNNSRQDYTRLNSAIHAAQPLLAERGFDAKQVADFLDPLTQMEGESWGSEFGSLVVLRSPEYFRYFHVREELKDSITVSDHFQVLPFVRATLDEQRQFFILALSKNRVRLLRCTNHSSEKVPLGPETPTSLEQWLNTRPPTTSPDHGETQASESGSTLGGFTSTTDRDNLDPHISNFFHRVDQAVFEALRGETAPLVLAAVEYEISMYRGLNRYPHLSPEHVHGAPDSLKGGELHKRALEAAQAAFELPMRKALDLYERLGGSERVSSKIKEIAEAAASGRVAHLFISEGIGTTSNNDTLNSAALQTIALGGEIWVTSPKNVPGGAPAVGLFRY